VDGRVKPGHDDGEVMPYTLVIFDLDGTLADSFPWFARELNGVADTFGFRRVAEGEVEALRHLPPRALLAHLGVPLWKLPRIAAHMRRTKSAAIDGIPLFPGVEAMLGALRDNGVTLALVTSDDEANARAQLGPVASLFAHFACGASLFGKAAKFRRVLRQTATAPGSAIAIGDELRDIEAARAAGIACGAVAWGYADPAALEAAKPDTMFVTMDEIAARLG
jgi:phosphoglycolate phosphatase